MSLGRIAKDQKSQKLLEVCKDQRSIVRRRHASHITVVLSKAAHSGPSVCVCEREPPAHFAYLVPERIAPSACRKPAGESVPLTTTI